MGDLLQFVEVSDGTVFLAVAQDQLGEVGVEIRVGDKFLVRCCVDIQFLDTLFVDVKICLQFGRVDVLQHIDLLQLREAVEAAKSLAVFHEFGGAFAPELRHGDQLVGVAAVDVDPHHVVHRFVFLFPEGRGRVGACGRARAESLFPCFRERVVKSPLFVGELLEKGFVTVRVAGRFRVCVAHEIVDVACGHDGEQEEGGRPFASGKVEFRFHGAKIPFRSGGCQEGDGFFYEQARVNSQFAKKKGARPS